MFVLSLAIGLEKDSCFIVFSSTKLLQTHCCIDCFLSKALQSPVNPPNTYTHTHSHTHTQSYVIIKGMFVESGMANARKPFDKITVQKNNHKLRRFTGNIPGLKDRQYIHILFCFKKRRKYNQKYNHNNYRGDSLFNLHILKYQLNKIFN